MLNMASSLQYQALKTLLENNTGRDLTKMAPTKSMFELLLNHKLINKYLSEMGFKVKLTNDELYHAMENEYSMTLAKTVLITLVIQKFNNGHRHIFSSNDIEHLLTYSTAHLAEMLETFSFHIDFLDLTHNGELVMKFKNTTSKLLLLFDKTTDGYTFGIEIKYSITEEMWFNIDDDDDDNDTPLEQRLASQKFYNSTTGPEILASVSKIFSGGTNWLIERNGSKQDPYVVDVCLRFDAISINLIFDLYPLFKILMVQFGYIAFEVTTTGYQN